MKEVFYSNCISKDFFDWNVNYLFEGTFKKEENEKDIKEGWLKLIGRFFNNKKEDNRKDVKNKKVKVPVQIWKRIAFKIMIEQNYQKDDFVFVDWKIEEDLLFINFEVFIKIIIFQEKDKGWKEKTKLKIIWIVLENSFEGIDA